MALRMVHHPVLSRCEGRLVKHRIILMLHNLLKSLDELRGKSGHEGWPSLYAGALQASVAGRRIGFSSFEVGGGHFLFSGSLLVVSC